MIDDDMIDPPFICPQTGVACIRAFCEDYGCADKARVPLDEHDEACGSILPQDIMPKLPAKKRKPRVKEIGSRAMRGIGEGGGR